MHSIVDYIVPRSYSPGFNKLLTISSSHFQYSFELSLSLDNVSRHPDNQVVDLVNFLGFM